MTSTESGYRKEVKMKNKRDMYNECYHCQFMEEVPGNAHIKCRNPDKQMTGDAHGIKNGWFFYPMLFDPTWKTKLCSNYQTNGVVSGAVSPENDHT